MTDDSKERRGTAAFVTEEPAFAFDAATVSGEGSVGADDAVAGNDDGDGVCSVSGADGADGSGAADFFGEFAVRGCGAAGNCAQGAPDLLLEGGAGGLDGKGVDGLEVSVEVAGERLGEAMGVMGGFEDESGCAVLVAQMVADAVVVIGEESEAEVAVVVSDDAHGANRCGELVDDEEQGVGHGGFSHEGSSGALSLFAAEARLMDTCVRGLEHPNAGPSLPLPHLRQVAHGAPNHPSDEDLSPGTPMRV